MKNNLEHQLPEYTLNNVIAELHELTLCLRKSVALNHRKINEILRFDLDDAVEKNIEFDTSAMENFKILISEFKDILHEVNTNNNQLNKII